MDQVVDCAYSLRYDFGSQRLPIFAVPAYVTRHSLGQKLTARMRERNFLCEYVWNCQWLRQTLAPPQGNIPTLFDRVLVRERAGPNNPQGFIRRGDLLNPAFTELQQVDHPICKYKIISGQAYVNVMAVWDKLITSTFNPNFDLARVELSNFSNVAIFNYFTQ
jgi:hypothetical protein